MTEGTEMADKMIEHKERELLAEDVRVEMWPEQTTGMHVGMPSGVKVTHKPTGIVVICDTERSQHKNREKALDFITRTLESAGQGEAQEMRMADARATSNGAKPFRWDDEEGEAPSAWGPK